MLQAQRCEFLFGTTAPDVQVVSGQLREETHFFCLPIRVSDLPGWEILLSRYPRLASAERLPVSQAAFLAGYICHIQADWLWIKHIFAPVFGPGCGWGTFQERLYYHNVLRAYLDQQLLPALSDEMDICLRGVQPDGWLPFVIDDHLCIWRDFLSTQLEPGAIVKTVEVFSSRQGISAPKYYTLLESTERMQREIFAHIPLKHLQSYRDTVLDENVRLLTHYMAFALHQKFVLIGGCLVEGDTL